MSEREWLEGLRPEDRADGVSDVERLTAWVDNIQLSARLGTPQYANTSELKADIRTILARVQKLEAALWEIAEPYSLSESLTYRRDVARAALSEEPQ